MTKKLIQLASAIIITLTLTHFSSAHAQTASNQCNNTSVDSTCIAPNPQSYTPVSTCNNPYACGTATPTTPTTPVAPTGGSSITPKPSNQYSGYLQVGGNRGNINHMGDGSGGDEGNGGSNATYYAIVKCKMVASYPGQPNPQWSTEYNIPDTIITQTAYNAMCH